MWRNLHFAMLAEGDLPQPSADRVVGSCRSLFQGTFRVRKALQQKDAQPQESTEDSRQRRLERPKGKMEKEEWSL